MSQREDFVRCARAQVGKRYVWATAGPNTFDCSGLVAYCYQQATGHPISRSSHEQMTLGVFVDKFRNATAMDGGDLVFWGNGDHVGIYVGDGQVVNALNEQRGVVTSALDANYGMPYSQARRIFFSNAVVHDETAPAYSPGEDMPAPVEEPRSKRKRRERRRREDRQ